MAMLTMNDFRIGWRQLVADPAYSAVVVLGLSVAIAAGYLIAALLGEKLIPDAAVPEPDRVVKLEFKGNIPGRTDDWYGAAPFVFRDALRDSKAPVTAIARVSGSPGAVTVSGKAVKADVLFADPAIVPIFGLKAKQGDVFNALTRPDTIALTDASAQKLFGTQNVIGRTVVFSGQTLTVNAVLPKQAGNSELQFDALVGFDSKANGLPADLRTAWFFINGAVYARLAPQATATQIGDLAQSLFDHSPEQKEWPPAFTANGRKAAFLRATPLDRLTLFGAGSDRNRLLLGSLALVALTMLALAAVNYINLTTVRTLQRQREIGIRKSLGASPLRLVGQFMAESVLVVLLAGAVGLLLSWLLAPVFSDLVEVNFDDRLFTGMHLAAALLGFVMLGVATGLYPARIALGINCAESLAGRSHSENASGRWLRRVMTTAQFAAAMTLTAVASVVLWQTHYASTMDYGYKTGELVAVDVPQTANAELGQAFYDALLRTNGVTGVAASDDVPSRNSIGRVSLVKAPKGDVSVRRSDVIASYFGVYGMRVLDGQIPAVLTTEPPKGAERQVVIDEIAAQKFGFEQPQAALGFSFKTDGTVARVAAVINTVRLESLQNKVEPHVFMLTSLAALTHGEVITVAGSSVPVIRRAITDLWPHYFPNEVPTTETVSFYVQQNYKSDAQIGWLIAAASVMSLLLASFGVYALAAYTVRRKTREIVIRKLYGAGPRAIGKLLLREFGALLALGAAAGLPLAWLAGEQYLANYVERAPIGLWPLAAALAAALVVTLLATLRHTLAALQLRPALALQG